MLTVNILGFLCLFFTEFRWSSTAVYSSFPSGFLLLIFNLTDSTFLSLLDSSSHYGILFPWFASYLLPYLKGALTLHLLSRLCDLQRSAFLLPLQTAFYSCISSEVWAQLTAVYSYCFHSYLNGVSILPSLSSGKTRSNFSFLWIVFVKRNAPHCHRK